MGKITLKIQLFIVCFFLIVESHNLPVLFLFLEQFGMAYSNEGILIDSTGAFRTFVFGTEENVGFFNIHSKLPDDMDLQLLAISIPTGRMINSDSLIEMRSIIDTVGEEEISYGVGPEDVTNYRLSAFVWDSINSVRREIICFQAGTAPVCNSSSAARTLVRYLLSTFSLDITHPDNYPPPDSCFNVYTMVYPIRNRSFGNNQSVLTQYYNLNGKKLNGSTRQLIIGKDGKEPINLNILKEK